MTEPALHDLLLTADAEIVKAAAPFHAAVQKFEWKPSIWSDEGEVTFEWIREGKHAVVTFDRDGLYGYAMLVGGRFVPGATDMPSPGAIPPDLAAYLSTP
ncbi:hypothetical protein O9X80_07730 [Agrobacterium salinitolerans]|uniref:hypothetical protein n=1 Tax=Agrobacterium salinitolerans TaxID=1183413 RepID=UPI0022B84B17|nr:hypothetical protein [Agrobacterium salinitolerans]MCZ7974378.1 hypothetical protein [Agrobacterium salinitolerans]